jgi:hypothetical protein
MNTTAAVIPEARPLEDEWVVISQIADLADVQPNAVNQWRNRFSAEALAAAQKAARDAGNPEPEWLAFPVEDDAVGAFPIWRLERVVAWLDATQRKYDLKAFRAKRDAGFYRRLGKKDGQLNARWRKTA